MDEVKNDQHVMISLKQMREICTQFSEVEIFRVYFFFFLNSFFFLMNRMYICII